MPLLFRDCTVLLESCLKYDNLLTEITGLSPLSSSVTASSFVNKAFRWKYMPLRSISAPNESGVAARGRTSMEGSRFLAYLDCTLGIQMTKEARMGVFVVDGYIDSVPNELDFEKLRDIPIGASVAIEYNGMRRRRRRRRR